MTDVKITFHIQLAKQSQAVKKFVTDIKRDIESLNKTIVTQSQRAAKSVDGVTASTRRQKKAVQEVTAEMKKQQAEVDRLSRRYRQQQANIQKSISSMPSTLANAATHPQVLSPSRFQSAGLFGGFNVPRQARAQLLANRQLQARMQSTAQRNHNQFSSMIPTNPAALAGVSGAASVKNSVGQFVTQQQTANMQAFANGFTATNKAASQTNRIFSGVYRTMVRTAGGVTQLNAALSRTPVLMQAVNNWFRTIRGAFNYAIFLALTAAIATLIANFVQFDAKMRETSGLSKEVRANYNQVADAVANISAKYPKMAGDAAAAFRDIVSSTKYAVGAQLQLLDVTLALSTAAFVPAAVSTDALTSVLNAYNLTADKAISVSDVLFQMMNDGKATVQELAEELGKVTPIAAAAGVEFTEVGAALAIMTQRGNNVARSSTALSRLINEMVRPSTQGRKFINEMLAGTDRQMDATSLSTKGLAYQIENLNIIAANYVAQQKGMNKTFKEFNKEAQDLVGRNQGLSVEALGNILTDQENRNAAAAFLGPDAVNQFNTEVTAMQNSAGATRDAFAEAAKSYQVAGQTFIRDVSNSFNSFATTIAPSAAAALLMFGKILVGVFNVLGKALGNGLVQVVLLGTAFIALGKLTWAVFAQIATRAVFALILALNSGSIASSAFWLALMGPVGWVLTAFVALVAVVTHFTQGQVTMAGMIATGWNIIIASFKIVIAVVYSVVEGFALVGAVVVSAFVVAGDAIGAFIDFCKDNFPRIPAMFKNAWITAVNAMKNVLEDALNVVVETWNKTVDFLHLPEGMKSEWRASFEDTPLDPEGFVVPMRNVKKFGDVVRATMSKMGFDLDKSPMQAVEEAFKNILPYATPETVKQFFFDAVGIPSFELSGNPLADLAQQQQDITDLSQIQADIIDFEQDIISQIKGAADGLIESFRNASNYMAAAGYSANLMSETFLSINELKMRETVLNTLQNMSKMADGLRGIGNTFASELFQRLQPAILNAQNNYLSASDVFLQRLLSFGSPEEMAEIFARQNYISQNVNQNVVIAPYIQIDGAQDEEAILETVDRALTDWAAANGFSTGR